MRTYERTHPWITFKFDANRISHLVWMMLGEADSKRQHIAGAPLQPDVAEELRMIYLSKGVHGTTSIEGNTLTEREVRARVKGELPLPPSREYLGREIDNVLAAYNLIIRDLYSGNISPITPERITAFNKLILDGLPLEEGVAPGEIRAHTVGVASYRGAPAEDCEYLLQELCRWLAEDFVTDDSEMKFAVAVMKAVIAHLYIAWIHPFGDGNGRTARLIEFQFLTQAGVPLPAAHLLSDHYNMTRDAYYQALARTSREPYPVEEFIQYAMQGFVDALRSQLQVIKKQQLNVTWEHYVHTRFHHQETKAKNRQKHLVLDLLPDQPTPLSKIREVSPRIAAEYASKGPKTVTRDINALLAHKLIRRVRGGIVPNRDLVLAFLPFTAPPEDA